jgi:hypothetical protein
MGKKHPLKEHLDQKHERKLQQLGRDLNQDPEMKNVHYSSDAKDDPRLQALSRAFSRAAKRKLN